MAGAIVSTADLFKQEEPKVLSTEELFGQKESGQSKKIVSTDELFGPRIERVQSSGGMLPSMPPEKPAQIPPPMNQLKVYGLLEGMPIELATGLKKAALDYEKGGTRPLREEPIKILDTLGTMYWNIEPNISEIIRDTSSFVMLVANQSYKYGVNLTKDLNDIFNFAITQHPNAETEGLPGPLPRSSQQINKGIEIAKKVPSVLYNAVISEVDRAKEIGVDHYINNFVKERPVDAMLLLNAVRAAAGTGTRITLGTAKKVARNGSKFADSLEGILSVDRSPLVYELPYENVPKLGSTPVVRQVAKRVIEPRVYSKDPITKYMYQKSFDYILDKYPKLKGALSEYKSGKYLTELRKTYDRANVEQRIKMHSEINSMLGTLTDDELRVMVPYLEGRASILGNTSEEFQKFEGWYRDFMKKGSDDLMSRGIIDPERHDEIIYGPLMKATGKSLDEVKSEFGNFKPAYVHQAHTEYPKGLSVEFADTTGKRYKPGILKRRRVGQGYSEDLSVILPKWASEYVKFKNTEAYLKEMTDTFGIPVNIKNVKQVHGGFQVGDKLYPGYKIVAPDGYLRFYRGSIDFYKEVSKKLDGMDLDEAIATTIKETVEGFKESSKVVGGAGEALSKQAKIIEDRVREALTARGFATGETEQMIQRVKSGGIESVKEIVTEREYTKVREILIKSGVNPDKLKEVFRGSEKNFIGVAKNQTVYLVPEKITQKLESWANPLISQSFQNFIKIAYDKPINLWKDSVLAMTPRWTKNNVIGDVMLNTMEGVGPLSYGRAFSAEYTKVIPDELMKASFANVMKYNPKLGSAAKNTVGQLIEKVENTKAVKGISKAKDAMYALNTAFEQPFVRSLYIKEARSKAVQILKAQKQPVNEASILYKMEEIKNSPTLRQPIINKVKETLPVFDISGNVERKLLKRMAPFYNWYKFMALYGAKLPFNHPFKTVGARGLGALSEVEREQAFIQSFPFMADYIKENGIPDRYDNLWPVSKPNEKGEATFFNSRGMNPFTTMEDIVQGDVVNMMSPIIKLAMERSTGKEAFTGRDYQVGEKGEGKFKEFRKEKPPLGEHILRQFPQYQLLKEILVPAKQWDDGTIFNPKPKIDKITGEYQYPIKNIDKILNYVGVDRKTIDIEGSWQSFQKSRQHAIGETFQKRQSQYDKYLTSDELKDLFNYIKTQEPEKWNKMIDEVRRNQQQREVEQRRRIESIRNP